MTELAIISALRPRDREFHDLTGRRLRKASLDPLFERKILKAIASLRALPTGRHHQLAAALKEALDQSKATGCNLPELLDQRALLARLIG